MIICYYAAKVVILREKTPHTICFSWQTESSFHVQQSPRMFSGDPLPAAPLALPPSALRPYEIRSEPSGGTPLASGDRSPSASNAGAANGRPNVRQLSHNDLRLARFKYLYNEHLRKKG